MSIQDIFLVPGHLASQFVISGLLAIPIEQADPVLYWVIAIITSLLFWVKAIGIVTTLIKRMTGFGR
ncbi:hypothetical protein QSV34_10625 [Porticoccus sp. W117]|uniref:hypothetical protein n=1 Tax=Porticoccus sp. W117 TaxID=3054777 RepID=UPI002596610D|nr:hypothetical protein [Porticoccus sp. W117]MDM3871805.1 hypothetical protein [Porticoccus sp. W117]